MNRIEIRKSWPTGKPRKIITGMNKRRRILCPTEILRTIRLEIILIIRTSKEIRIIHPAIRIILRVKKFLIIMEILPRTLSAKSLSSAGSVMAHTMLQSILIGRRPLAIFIPYRRR